ncbi:MAG: response regulator transcription factor [Candidatus Izemoplasmatales bacterium]
MALIYSVEDDTNIQHVIRIALQNSNMDVEMFGEAKSFFRKLEEQIPALVLLDIMLPDMDGHAILKRMKANPRWNRIPVLFLSAKGSEIDKVVGLDLGADDYLAKPFGVLELVSRVKALLRRSASATSEETLSIKGLVLNPKEYVCTYQDKKMTLTQKEFQLLKLLMQNHHHIVTRDEILNIVWGYDFVGETRTLDVHIKEVRLKLSQAGIEEEAIQTVRGVGYKFVL